MRIYLTWCLGLILSFTVNIANAHINPELAKQKPSTDKVEIDFREDCVPATSQMDMDINNVRARLTTGGDVWWNLQDGRYVVPKPPLGSGLPEVSSIFAGAVWIGGYDKGGNLKLAAHTYRSSSSNDFYPGPIDPVTGTTELDVCLNWDRFFVVTGEEIDEHIKNYKKAKNQGIDYDPSLVPDGVKYWPGKGNDNFLSKYQFQLPNTGQGLGSFWDEDEDGFYNPENGDYPNIEIRGCPLDLYPDQMIFWIYNDAGGAHTETDGNKILMEVQVQAFGFATNDEINDMTFQRYKLINRAPEDITQCYFAMWVDPDLGCHTDDYVGCDIDRSLAYVYNEDELDGTNNCSCDNGVQTYCDEVPILGIDYFRGPLAPKIWKDSVLVDVQIGEEPDTLIELGMSSFIYYNNGGIGDWPEGTTDPSIDFEYYNYLSGFWKDGLPITNGASGYNIGSTDSTKYVLPGDPNDGSSWSMCTAGLSFGDRRTLQASGPFTLKPQAVNELIIGAVWIPDVEDYPCPELSRLRTADDLAQNLFDNCFDLLDGPDAPDVDIVELDRELILILSNDSLASNNAYELYTEKDLFSPEIPDIDTTYEFEGYQIYQLEDATVSPSQLDDISKARLIQQFDLKNGISTLYNWKPVLNPLPGGGGESIFTFTKKVEGADSGLLHTFKVTSDQFSSDDKVLINHKPYYFMAVAYAHNEFDEFDPTSGTGQRRPYLEGRRNIKVYTGVPRTLAYENVNAAYGSGAVITRIQGVGAGMTYLDMEDGTHDKILDGSFDGRITYKEGQGPLRVNIYNPLEVRDGEFRFSIVGESNEDGEILEGALWIVEDLNSGDTIFAEKTLDQLNEQLFTEYGFSLLMSQSDEPGDQADDSNGEVGGTIELEEGGTEWLTFFPDGGNDDLGGPVLNFIKNGPGETDNKFDEKTELNNIGGTGFVPFWLCDYQSSPLITPAWKDNNGQSFIRTRSSLSDLNNVDIVLTKDKSKWSKCAVVETAHSDFYSQGFTTVGNTVQFDKRDSPSVLKDADGDKAKVDPNGGTGYGWFPGYAVDVETGERLNILFGENSSYNEDWQEYLPDSAAIGSDMMFNPSDDLAFVLEGSPLSIWNFILGGQHTIYVTRQHYDECDFIGERLKKGQSFTKKFKALELITWAGIPILNQGAEMLSYSDGLIPSDMTIKLRVDNAYQEETYYDVPDTEVKVIEGLPVYEFEIRGKETTDLAEEDYEGALEEINLVPNPYYGYSEYEVNQNDNVVKITNLPERADVTIYSLDGKYIQQFRRDERGSSQVDRSNPGINNTQPYPDIEWNLKNNKGIPVASGVYIIHVSAPELGEERSLKLFLVNRKFDPSGL